MEILEHAKLIALLAHLGQVDKGYNPYIEHPSAVASMVGTDELKTVAWMHDVVEDSPITIEDLRPYFPRDVVDAIDAITKRPNEDRAHYLNRVAENPMAARVKIADLTHNTDLSRIKNPTPRDFARAERYEEEIAFLVGALEEGCHGERD